MRPSSKEILQFGWSVPSAGTSVKSSNASSLVPRPCFMSEGFLTPCWMSKLCADRRVPFSRIRRGCHVLGRAKDPPAPGTRDEPRASRPGDVGSRPTEGDDEAVASQASHAGSPESLTRSGPPRQLPARCHAALVPILEGTVGRPVMRPSTLVGSPDALRASELPSSFFPSCFKQAAASRSCDELSRAIQSLPRRKVNEGSLTRRHQHGSSPDGRDETEAFRDA